MALDLLHKKSSFVTNSTVYQYSQCTLQAYTIIIHCKKGSLPFLRSFVQRDRHNNKDILVVVQDGSTVNLYRTIQNKKSSEHLKTKEVEDAEGSTGRSCENRK